MGDGPSAGDLPPRDGGLPGGVVLGAETLPGLDAALRARPAGLGAGRLVCLDGPAGSGKTTLATLLQERWRASLVHMDDLYEGWYGRDAGVRHLLDDVLAPLARGDEGRYRRYDWDADAPAEEHRVPPGPVLVVEGCGSAPRAVDGYDPLVVWVEVPADLRLRRGLARDGEAMRDHWLQWMAEEQDLYARERTRERAQVHIDGTRGAIVVARRNEEDA